MRLCIALCVVLLSAVPALAWDAPIQGAELGIVQWHPFNADKPISLQVDAAFHPWNPIGPETPTNLKEIIPWAKANFTFDLLGATTGDPASNIHVSAVGVAEKAKIAQIASVPVKAGIGYSSEDKWGWFVGPSWRFDF